MNPVSREEQLQLVDASSRYNITSFNSVQTIIVEFVCSTNTLRTPLILRNCSCEPVYLLWRNKSAWSQTLAPDYFVYGPMAKVLCFIFIGFMTLETKFLDALKSYINESIDQRYLHSSSIFKNESFIEVIVSETFNRYISIVLIWHLIDSSNENTRHRRFFGSSAINLKHTKIEGRGKFLQMERYLLCYSKLGLPRYTLSTLKWNIIILMSIK